MKKRKKAAASIGIIGESHGPVAVYVKKINTKSRQKKEAYWDRAQKLAKPCKHSFEELVAYLQQTYEAQLVALSESERRSIKVNVVLNHHPELVHREPMPENPTLKQLQEWHQRDTSFDQALAYPEEELGLVMEGYRIPEHIAKRLREEDEKSGRRIDRGFFTRFIGGWSRWINGEKKIPEKLQPLTIQLERTHEYMVASGKGGKTLMDELAFFGGVDEKDIAEKTPRFLAYANVMAEKGLWK